MVVCPPSSVTRVALCDAHPEPNNPFLATTDVPSYDAKTLLPMPAHTRPVPMVPQIVPSQTCLTCDVCCRFPEADSFLRPYFTPEEIRTAVAGGVAQAHFPNPAGGQVELVPHPRGEGFICPAFDVETSRCRIYEQRPLDCRLYPYAVMWQDRTDEIVLGWDTKCPFMSGGPRQEMIRTADRTAAMLESEEMTHMLAEHPRLIGRYQEDVSVVRPLPRVREALERIVGTFTLRPLTAADRPRMEAALAAAQANAAISLSAFSFAGHYLWHGMLEYSWIEIDRHLCLFAASPDGIFLALPPLGSGPLFPPLDAAFRYMRIRNHGGPATRVENVPEAYLHELTKFGYRAFPKDPDYLYRAADLADLSGDRFKSQRAACNRFEREHQTVCEPYHSSHRDACLQLLRTWQSQKDASTSNEWDRLLLEDAAAAHEVALTETLAAGLNGAVVTIEGVVRAYTFGMWLTPTVFCVAIEVADRSIPGLAQFIFRECCRAARLRGAEYINTMDDSGLLSLARSKRAYHPVAMLSNHVIMEP